MGLIKEPKNVDLTIQSKPWNEEELAPLHEDNRYLGVQPGKGAQPQMSRSGARLKKLSIKLATLNSPSTVHLTVSRPKYFVFPLPSIKIFCILTP